MQGAQGPQAVRLISECHESNWNLADDSSNSTVELLGCPRLDGRESPCQLLGAQVAREAG